jgi:hypothetical protein
VDTSKLSLGEQIAAVSGIVLLIVLFLPWYGVDVSTPIANVSASDSATAWQAFDFVDILLFLIALVAIAVPVARMTDSMPEDVPGAMLIVAAGGLGVLLVLWRIIDLPTPDISSIGSVKVDFSRKIGVFLGLIATAGVAYGGWRAMEESPVSSTPAASPPPPPPPPAPSEPPAAEPPAATS